MPLSEAQREEVCRRIADGETVRQIAASETMTGCTSIYLELQRDPTFAEQYARAREAQLERWEDEILEIADDGTNDWTERKNKDGSTYETVNHEHITRSKLRVDARRWLMAKRLPKKYGDRVAQELSGPNGGPIPVAKVEDMTREQLLAIAGSGRD